MMSPLYLIHIGEFGGRIPRLILGGSWLQLDLSLGLLLFLGLYKCFVFAGLRQKSFPACLKWHL